jgi:hypothetical protein
MGRAMKRLLKTNIVANLLRGNAREKANFT